MLSTRGQQHLLAFWSELDESQRQQLVEQIETIEFDLVARLVSTRDDESDWTSIAEQSRPPAAIELDSGKNTFTESNARAAGEAAIRQGRIGVIVVAGGQGSRLGFPHPKGMYPLGPVSKRTLFEIHADRQRALAANYGVEIPLYLMTSPATHDETVAYFADHQWLGLNPDLVRIFCQGTMPAVGAVSGRLLMESKQSVFLSPDGHGGMLAALEREGCLTEMQQRGVDQLFYFQVDNPLVAIADPAFVGYHLLAQSEMTTQVIRKQDPAEKVGVVVAVEDHLQIIEYSDLPDEAARRRNPDGSLRLWAGSIAVHMFDRSFLQRVAASQESLPFHRALKRVEHIDAAGQVVVPHQPNAIKFERFIFDLLPLAKNALVVEIAEADGFAPLKNAEGAPKDTAATARAAMIEQHLRWLAAANVVVDEGVQVEINPNFAGSPAELRAKLPAGQHFTQDTYLN